MTRTQHLLIALGLQPEPRPPVPPPPPLQQLVICAERLPQRADGICPVEHTVRLYAVVPTLVVTMGSHVRALYAEGTSDGAYRDHQLHPGDVYQLAITPTPEAFD